MAWGKESYDELKSLNVQIKSFENLLGEILHQISKDVELRFWQESVMSATSGLLSNYSADNVFRPDMIVEKAVLIADCLLVARKEKIEQMSKPEDEEAV